MNNNCIYKNKINQNWKHIKLLYFIIILLSLLLLVSCKQYIFSFFKIIFTVFNNESGKFDFSVFWSALSCIGSFLGFWGIIITIKYTESSRKKQNEYDVIKTNLIKEQEKFKVDMRKMFDDIDPIQVLNPILSVSTFNYSKIYFFILNYRAKIKTLSYKFNWYYSNKININEFAFYNDFLNKTNSFVDIIDPILVNCSILINEFRQVELYNNLISSNPLKPLPIEQQLKLKEFVEKYPNGCQDYSEDLKRKISSELIKLIDYRNTKWENEFIFSCKNMIEERNKWVEAELSKIR